MELLIYNTISFVLYSGVPLITDNFQCAVSQKRLRNTDLDSSISCCISKVSGTKCVTAILISLDAKISLWHGLPIDAFRRDLCAIREHNYDLLIFHFGISF